MSTPQTLQFQGSAESKGFAPITPASSTKAAVEDANRLSQSWDTAAQHNLMQEKRAIAFQDAQTQNNVQALSVFSNTLTQYLIEEDQRRYEADVEEGLNMAYIDGVSEVDALAFDIAESHLKTQDEQIQQMGDQIQAGGGDFLAVQRFRELSGGKKYGYAMGHAQNLSFRYPQFIEETLASLDPELSSADKAAALATARQQFFRQTGMLGINPALLNKYAFPTMREVDAQMMNRWRKDEVSRQQEALIGEAQEILGADPVGNFGKSLDTLVRSGKFNRTTARDALLEMITDTDDIDAIGNSLSWDGVKTWAEKYPIQWAAARRRAVQAEDNIYQTEKLELQTEGKKWFDSVVSLWQQTPPSEEEIEEVKLKMQDEFGGFIDPRLEQWVSRSTDAESAKYYQDFFERLDRAGQLTEAAVNAPDVPDSVRQRYLQSAQQQDKARKDAPEFTQYSKQIEDDLKRAAQYNGLGSPGAPGLELAIARAQAEFQREYMRAVQGGGDPSEAAAAAYARVNQQILLGQNLDTNLGKTSPYFIDPGNIEDGFVNVIPKGITTKWQDHKDAVANALATNKLSALDRNRLIPKPILEEAIAQANNPGYTPPAIAQYISDRTGGTVSPWEVLDRQAKAQGLPGLPPNPRFQEVTAGIRPELQRLLHYKPSYRRVARAYASAGNFDPTRIPRGYGDIVVQAATTYGIPPAILAGLIETESTWDPNARSSAGAIGIAQIVPKFHPNVDPTKPNQAIMYAAKYLSELQQQLGSLDEAIYAYNGGPGGIRKSKENREYHPKVMRAAAKYGFNPTGNPWSNPSLLNPRLAYVTGKIGPTSTGPHLDVKRADGGDFAANALDRYVEVDDSQYGRVPLSRVGVTADAKSHRARGSHGIDYGTYDGSKVYLKGGAKVVSSVKTEHGDKLTIQLPNGQKYTFLHGRRA
jgi:hypothetical protein